MIRKIAAILITCVMLAALAVSAFAGAMNPADGCKTEVTLKKAASGAVVHDGIISDGEYNEIEINRDSDTTDLLLSWNGSGDLLLKACEFLKNVHFYASWDENGINFAAKATLLEDPLCGGTMPETVNDYVGDEFFMFDFGLMAKIENPDDIDNEILYRTFGINTQTGEILVGSYWANGHTGSLSLAEGRDYYVKVNGRTVTYEVTYPHASVLKADQLSGGQPVDGSRFYFTLSLTGGSAGGADSSYTYAVSLGDGGYMTVAKLVGGYSGALATISSDPVVEDGKGGQGGQGDHGGNQGSGDQQVVIDPDKYEVKTDESGNEVIIDKATGETVDRSSLPVAARTGDPMIVMAAVAAVSAAGAFIVRKRKY